MIATVICLVLLVLIGAYVRWVIRPERERPLPATDYDLTSGTWRNYHRERHGG